MVKSLPVEERIQWHEGMLLSPQHFQQASARLDSLVALHTLLAAPFSWGVRSLKIDMGLLPAGIVRVQQLEAIMPDGTSVSFSADNAQHGTLELKLAPFAEALGNAPLDFYLVLPLTKSMRDKGSPSRFRSVAMGQVEDEVSEALPADLPRLLPNLSLVAGDVPSGIYTWLRLGTVFKDNELIKMGETLPALIEMPKDGVLWERVSAFVGQLRGKAAFVAKQTAVPSSKTEDRLAYLEQRERLRNLMTGLPQVEAVLRTPSLHPYPLYLALCALLGPLSMLKPGALPPVPPEYDHADPLAVLNPVLEALQDSLMEISQEYREHKFEYRHGAFEINLLPEWVDKQLVVGLRGQPEKDLVAWMNGAIVGSQSAYASLRERRVLGAMRSHIEVAQELGVRASSGYTLFSIQASAALTLANEPLIVSNSTESASAQRPQEMVLFVKG
ncbi:MULTISPECIES: type VI secretion system baseplate subunit TssK [unclassified Polaromonas]|jgi:type VI secretion system protein ImpJ|uniref:type VI secretion system baseplate subunit TssK n=1 Tax=unclassified Polaromonas TaxID=2638319 RepID=UPI000BD439FB|nr:MULTISPECIES: type VI secretion system baseplate subunit TssK [unclassified Polaromonas]OYY34353.1 MAG: type VI secretion system-associated protein [Polaromonas sp. 35-63-35]OYZ17853.1 MAG: type VI secretion system-associated protein [Polaromonas sp. 16-63-31]OYZ77251.1 MAG: type VI secretion system-associated protein [Polaromonas sp. 24-63-21]OZA48183.1 MAG: type VI secretion system-associated protein [Polaromonas sp. 17-63-33]OZA86709.1 MAG: type VI secretion system-associated protein [Po